MNKIKLDYISGSDSKGYYFGFLVRSAKYEYFHEDKLAMTVIERLARVSKKPGQAFNYAKVKCLQTFPKRGRIFYTVQDARDGRELYRDEKRPGDFFGNESLTKMTPFEYPQQGDETVEMTYLAVNARGKFLVNVHRVADSVGGGGIILPVQLNPA